LITLVLLVIIAIPIASLPQANANTPTWKIPSFGYLVTAPNPVEVGQRVSIMMWVDLPMPNAVVTKTLDDMTETTK
jgi:hypothetical protein